MTAEEKQNIRYKIASLITKSQDDIEDIEKSTQPIAPENSIGRVSRMDAINSYICQRAPGVSDVRIGRYCMTATWSLHNSTPPKIR